MTGYFFWFCNQAILIELIFRFKEIDLNCAVRLRNKNHIYVYEPDHIGDESEDDEDQEWQLAENEENGTIGEEEDESGVGRVFTRNVCFSSVKMEFNLHAVGIWNF